MKAILIALVLFLSKAFGGDDKKSVHFKIHVPEIIKHHIHTKTIFIHVHEMKPPDSKKHKEESHVEDWTSYNSYNYKDGVEENHAGDYRRNKQKQAELQYDDYMPLREDDYQPVVSYEYDSPDNHLTNEPPVHGQNPLGLFGPPVDPEELDPRGMGPPTDPKLYPPPGQYSIHEDVDEGAPPPNDYQNVKEANYHRGMKSETGRVVHKELKDFYDKGNDEEQYSKDGYENNSYDKYANHGYHGNYDKEIGLEQRSGKKHADRRYFVARMVIR